VVIALFAAPAADIVSMIILAIPMIGLYFVAAGIAWLHDRRAAKKAAALAAQV